jgi:hypothetical protein
MARWNRPFCPLSQEFFAVQSRSRLLLFILSYSFLAESLRASIVDAVQYRSRSQFNLVGGVERHNCLLQQQLFTRTRAFDLIAGACSFNKLKLHHASKEGRSC